MKESTTENRKVRILDAAEKAFADFGFAGASLRHIVGKAAVNLPTVYYHFGSKQGLMEAVFKRRFGPLRQGQLELLKQFDEEANGQPLAAEKVLEAMLLPPLRLAMTGSAKHQAVTRLIGRIVTEPNPQTQRLLRRQQEKVRTVFIEAMGRSLPRIPRFDVRWRLEFIWGALAFILCNPRRIEDETQEGCDPVNTQNVLSQMLNFFSAGLHAPAACQVKRTSLVCGP
jgi:AcrR family transcriptional regulator